MISDKINDCNEQIWHSYVKQWSIDTYYQWYRLNKQIMFCKE